MKKQKVVKFQKTNPDWVANNMKKGMGRDRAFHVAENIAKNLATSHGDGTILTEEEVRKSERTWVHVRNILAKMK